MRFVPMLVQNDCRNSAGCLDVGAGNRAHCCEPMPSERPCCLADTRTTPAYVLFLK
jgi:hypothetical protein